VRLFTIGFTRRSAQCHRRLVAEYLREKWDNVEVEHL
jgi:hypothetical protein